MSRQNSAAIPPLLEYLENILIKDWATVQLNLLLALINRVTSESPSPVPLEGKRPLFDHVIETNYLRNFLPRAFKHWLNTRSRQPNSSMSISPATPVNSTQPLASTSTTQPQRPQSLSAEIQNQASQPNPKAAITCRQPRPTTASNRRKSGQSSTARQLSTINPTAPSGRAAQHRVMTPQISDAMRPASDPPRVDSTFSSTAGSEDSSTQVPTPPPPYALESKPIPGVPGGRLSPAAYQNAQAVCRPSSHPQSTAQAVNTTTRTPHMNYTMTQAAPLIDETQSQTTRIAHHSQTQNHSAVSNVANSADGVTQTFNPSISTTSASSSIQAAIPQSITPTFDIIDIPITSTENYAATVSALEASTSSMGYMSFTDELMYSLGYNSSFADLGAEYWTPIATPTMPDPTATSTLASPAVQQISRPASRAQLGGASTPAPQSGNSFTAPVSSNLNSKKRKREEIVDSQPRTGPVTKRARAEDPRVGTRVRQTRTRANMNSHLSNNQGSSQASGTMTNFQIGPSQNQSGLQ